MPMTDEDGVAAPEDCIVNLPTGGNQTVSFFSYHGDMDTDVPAGGPIQGDFYLEKGGGTVLDIARIPHPENYTPGYLPLSQTRRAYMDANGLGRGSITRTRLDISGTDTAYSRSYPDSDDPDATNPQFNPTVVDYRDPLLTHSGFLTGAVRVFAANDVWRFFRNHPRRPLLDVQIVSTGLRF